MTDEFEWNDKKAADNFDRHGVAFEEAQTVFGDRRALTVYDRTHSIAEDRWITIGLSIAGRLLVVVHTDREGGIRIISARAANRAEERQYAESDD
jgi:uncharacterized DUF497 family protein